jgi:hypothetical protein
MMKRIKSNYHQQVLKTAKPRLRKAIIKAESEFVKTISECVLNVLRNNVQLTPCRKKKLQNFKGPRRALADKRVRSHLKNDYLIKWWFYLRLLSAILPRIASLIFRSQNVT